MLGQWVSAAEARQHRRGYMALVSADRPVIANPQIFNSLLWSRTTLVLWALMFLCAHGRPSYTIVYIYIYIYMCNTVPCRYNAVDFLHDIHKRHQTLWALMFLCAHEPPSYTIVCLYMCNTLPCRYNAVNFLHDIHKRHHTPHSTGRGMGCLLWVSASDWFSASVPTMMCAISLYWTALWRTRLQHVLNVHWYNIW